MSLLRRAFASPPHQHQHRLTMLVRKNASMTTTTMTNHMMIILGENQQHAHHSTASAASATTSALRHSFWVGGSSNVGRRTMDRQVIPVRSLMTTNNKPPPPTTTTPSSSSSASSASPSLSDNEAVIKGEKTTATPTPTAAAAEFEDIVKQDEILKVHAATTSRDTATSPSTTTTASSSSPPPVSNNKEDTPTVITTTTNTNVSKTSTLSDTSPPSSSSSSSSSSFLPSWMDDALEVWKKQSGTAEVLALKEDVSHKSHAFDAASVRVTHARRTLDETMLLWERTNGQHLQLMQRRDSWTSADAQQFATLIGKEVETRTAMEMARKELTASEQNLSHCQLEYMNAMRKRYHEEQIWQDQWRVLGTYGTWALIMLNSCVFLASQFFHYQREARKLKHLEYLVKENVASQEAFKDSMVAERQAFAAEKATTATTATAATTTATKTTTASSSALDDKDDVQDSSTTTAAANTTVAADKREEPTEESSSLPSSSNSSSSKPLPEWLVKLRETKWVKSITSSELVLSSIQNTKALYQSTKKESLSLYHQTKAQTEDFIQEVHVPSAILGASVTGVAGAAVLVLLLLLPTSSNGSGGNGR